MLQFIKFALFNINTGDKLYEMDNIPIFIPKTSNIFKYLKQIYPMFNISLYRVGTINTMIGLSDEQKNALMQSQIDNHGDNLLDALCLGLPVDNDAEIDNTLLPDPYLYPGNEAGMFDNLDQEYEARKEARKVNTTSGYYNPGLSTPDFKGE